MLVEKDDWETGNALIFYGRFCHILVAGDTLFRQLYLQFNNMRRLLLFPFYQLGQTIDDLCFMV